MFKYHFGTFVLHIPSVLYFCSFLCKTDKPASIHPGTTIIYVDKAENVTYGNTTIVHTYNKAHRKVNKKS